MVFKKDIRTMVEPKTPKGFKYEKCFNVTDERAPFTTPSVLVLQYLKNNPQPLQNENEEVLDIQPYDDISDYGSDIQSLGGVEKILKQNQKPNEVTRSRETK